MPQRGPPAKESAVNQAPQITMHDGRAIPQIGLGTYRLTGELAHSAVNAALEVGYRHIDTATLYENESEIGQVLAASGLAREDYFVTSKLWADDLPEPRRAIETSLAKLGLDQLDLYLIHWPAVVGHGDLYIEAWDALQGFQEEGLAASIGVSNFNDNHVAQLRGVTPAINQVELHPTFTQPQLQAQMKMRGIPVAAWSPLGRARDLTQPVIQQIAEATGRTPGQVVLRWHLQGGRVVIPRSSNPDRIAENFNIVDFELSDEQCEQIELLNNPETGRTRGMNPETDV